MTNHNHHDDTDNTQTTPGRWYVRAEPTAGDTVRVSAHERDGDGGITIDLNEEDAARLLAQLIHAYSTIDARIYKARLAAEES